MTKPTNQAVGLPRTVCAQPYPTRSASLVSPCGASSYIARISQHSWMNFHHPFHLPPLYLHISLRLPRLLLLRAAPSAPCAAIGATTHARSAECIIAPYLVDPPTTRHAVSGECYSVSFPSSHPPRIIPGMSSQFAYEDGSLLRNLPRAFSISALSHDFGGELCYHCLMLYFLGATQILLQGVLGCIHHTYIGPSSGYSFGAVRIILLTTLALSALFM